MKIGFDFGTSFSAVSVYREGEVHRVMFDGEPQFRTAIYFPPYAPIASHFIADNHFSEISSIRAALSRMETEAKVRYKERVSEERTKILTQARNDSGGYTASGELSKKYKSMLADALSKITEPINSTEEEKDRRALNTARRQWLESEASKDRALGNLEQSQLDEALFGDGAVDAYFNNGGRGLLLYNPKVFLGHDLPYRVVAPLERAIGSLFKKVIESVEKQFPGESISEVTIGRPVHFSRDQSELANNKAISIISRSAELAGFRKVSFMYEPGAASYHFHGSLATRRKALVVDLGGGTTDLSLVSVGGSEPAPVIHRQQGYYMGGNDVDRALNLAAFMPFFGKGCTVKKIPALNSYFAYAAYVQNIIYQKKFFDANIKWMPEPFRQRLESLKKTGNTIVLNRLAEESKVELGKVAVCRKAINFIDGDNEVEIGYAVYYEAMRQYLDKLKGLLHEFSEEDFDLILLTGGMCRAKGLPDVVQAMFPDKKVWRSDSTLDVVSGLAIYAAQQGSHRK